MCAMTLYCVAFSVFLSCHLSLTCCFIFFFKQKTAYEMRISDWSSDVCSSDLLSPASTLSIISATASKTSSASISLFIAVPMIRFVTVFSSRPMQIRSEEHTSELQSLMRTSYAVFCLKKKITYKSHYEYNNHNTTLDRNQEQYTQNNLKITCL